LQLQSSLLIGAPGGFAVDRVERHSLVTAVGIDKTAKSYWYRDQQVSKDLIEKFAPRVTGWFGNESPFAFTMPDQSYAENVWRFMGGTPAVASLYQARAGHTLIGEIGVRKIREKSLVMTQKCIDWVDELGMKLNSPRPAQLRGGSVVFDFASAGDVCRELNRRKFFCDHRPGAGIRIAPHFYTKSEEIDLLFGELKKIRGGTGH